MKLLKDDELVPLVTGANPIIRDIPQPEGAGAEWWYSKDSPVQPSSIDVHIGSIFLPGAKKEEEGAQSKPKTEHSLKRGETAVVTTLEKLEFPGHIAAFGLPPSSVSFRGILITNPGHVDPGYVGRMRFTIINMGKEEYPFRRGDVILTLLLVELSRSSSKNWLARRGGKVEEPPTQHNIDQLSADFLDVEKRATEIAKKAVGEAELDIKKRQVVFPIVAALIALIASLVTGYIGWLKPAWQELDKVKTEVEVLKANLNIAKIDARLTKAEEVLGIKQTPQSVGSSQGGPPQGVLREAPGTTFRDKK